MSACGDSTAASGRAPDDRHSRSASASRAWVVGSAFLSQCAHKFVGDAAQCTELGDEIKFHINGNALYAAGDGGFDLWGVFDGHGKTGDHCAGYVRDQLPGLLKAKCKEHPQDFEKAYKEAFIQVNEGLHKSSIDDSLSGTTAIVVLFEGGTIHVANVGDTRVVLVGDGAPSAVLALRNAFEQSDAHGIAALRGLELFPLDRCRSSVFMGILFSASFGRRWRSLPRCCSPGDMSSQAGARVEAGRIEGY